MAAITLSAKEVRYWGWALEHPPLGPALDALPASKVALQLQTRLADAPGEAWAQVALMVQQLQEARRVLARAVPAKRKSSKAKAAANGLRAVTAPGPPLHVKQRPAASAVSASAASPIGPPPTRPKGPAFCASDVQASMETMRRHCENARIQELGCRAVLELLRAEKKRRMEDKALRLAWLCAACKFRNEKGEERCRVCYLTKAAECAVTEDGAEEEEAERRDGAALSVLDQIDAAGGITLVVDAMRRFKTNVRVQRAAAFALAQLVHEDSRVVQAIASAGGVAEVLGAMDLLRADAEVQTQCLGILACPELVEDSVVRVEPERFARVCCAALARHRKGRLQALGALALGNVALKSDAVSRRLVEEMGCHELLLDAMSQETNTANAHVSAACLWALATLAREVADGWEMQAREVLRAAGAVQATMDCLARLPSSQVVLSNGKLLFSRLGVSEASCAEAAAERGTDCIVS